MDVSQTKKSERSEHQDANARAKVAAINRDQELKTKRQPNSVWWRLSRRPGLLSHAPETALSQKENGREEDEKRHHFRERFFFGQREEDAAEQSARQADRQESFQPRLHRSDMAPIAEHAAASAEDQRQCAGSIGNDFGRADQCQRGKGNEGAPAGHGVNDAGSGGGQCQKDDFFCGQTCD